MKLRLNCINLLVALLFFVKGFAQQTHFIYIQSDDKQPFSASVDNTIYNSSETGYIIISKLNEGEHEIKISAITKSAPEQIFKITVGRRDAGYGLAGDNSNLHLYNLRTKEIIAAGDSNVTAATDLVAGDNNTLMFAQILSQVVNDPDLTKKIDYSKTVIAKDVVYTNGADTVQQQPQSQPVLDDSAEAVKNTAAADIRGIIKDAEVDGKEGKEITFIEFNSAGNDTIHVTIPLNEMTAGENATNETAANNTTNESAKVDSSVVKTDANNSSINNPFFKNDTANTTNTEISNKTVITNSTCDKMLSDDELYKLKRKLFTEPDHDKMIPIFKKNVKNKCVTTDQVKVLGSYFLSDESRLNFYSAAYAYVYDHANYSTLENQLFDKSIRQQFHQLISNSQN